MCLPNKRVGWKILNGELDASIQNPLLVLYTNLANNTSKVFLLVHSTYRPDGPSYQTASHRPFVLDELNVFFLPSSRTSHARTFKVMRCLVFSWASWTRVDLLLRSSGLEHRLSSLKVAPVVLGANEGEDDDVGGYNSDEDALDESIVWHIFSFNSCPGVLSAS